MGTEFGINIKEIVIKIIMVVLFVFLLMWLFPMPNMSPIYDRLFAENIETMKTAAKSYFTVERLPKELNETVYITLEEMEQKHLILPLVDGENNVCDVRGSYVEIMKTESEYVIKTHLSCPSRTDYVIEHMGDYDFTKEVENVALVEEEPNIQKQVSRPAPAPIIKVVPVTIPKVESEPAPKPEPKPELKPKPKPEPKPEPKPTPQPVYELWVLYGKGTEVEYSNWTTTKRAETSTTRDGVTTKVEVYRTYDEEVTSYVTKNKELYSSLYIYPYVNYSVFLDYPGERLLDLDNIGVSRAAQRLSKQDLNLRVTSWGGLETITDFNNYARYKTLYFYTPGANSNNSVGVSSSAMKASSLRYGKDFKIISAGVGLSNNGYYVSTKARLYNTYYDFNNANPYYDNKLGQYIIYVPHKFVVTWNEPTTHYIREYCYKTIYTYADKWVQGGSSEELKLINKGYYQKSTKLVQK